MVYQIHPCTFSFSFFFLKSDWFESQSDKDRDRERESIHRLTPHMVTTARSVPCQSQKLGFPSESPTKDTSTQATFGALAGSLLRSGTVGTWNNALIWDATVVSGGLPRCATAPAHYSCQVPLRQSTQFPAVERKRINFSEFPTISPPAAPPRYWVQRTSHSTWQFNKLRCLSVLHRPTAQHL